MPPNKVIEQVDAKRINAYSEEDKFRWISDVDGMIKKFILKEEVIEPYKFPEDGDRELLAPYPFDEMYGFYVEAMVDYYNREYDYYNEVLTMFYTRFDEYRKAYIREHMPKSAGYFKM